MRRMIDIPNDLWAIVAWAKKPVWYDHHIVYPATNGIGVEVCTESEWAQRGEKPVLATWQNGRLIFPTAE